MKQAIQFPLAELATECEMTRWLVRKTAWELDKQNHMQVSDAVSMCNYRGNRLACNAADQAIQIFASPGQFILLPLGLILFGVYIQQAPELPVWGRPVTLVVGLVGFVGIMPTILNLFGYDGFLFLAELSGLVLLLGWILIGVVLWREAVTPAEETE